jgi:hypothetical protein
MMLLCFPIANSSDQQEKAAQPFFFSAVSVPRADEYIEVVMGHTTSGIGALRKHLFKVIRITHTESGIKLLVMEDRVQRREA